MDEALDWASINASVLNNSYWFPDDGSSSSYSGLDRHMDYVVRSNYDFAVVSAGNHAASGCPRFTPYVPSPGKGYNALMVDDYTDNDTPGWIGDTMAACSGFGDPRGDGTSNTHANLTSFSSGPNLNIYKFAKPCYDCAQFIGLTRGR